MIPVRSVAEAIGHHIVAGEYPQAADLIDQQAEIWMRHGEVGAIAHALSQLPDIFVQQHLGLCMWSGWVHTLIGEPDEAAYWLQQTKRLLTRTFPTPDQYTGGMLHRYRNVAGQLLTIGGLLAHRNGKRADAIAACQQALALLPPGNPQLRVVAAMIMAIAGIDLADSENMLSYFQQLRRTAFATEQPFVLLSILMHEAGYLLQHGQLQQAFQLSKRALAYLEEESNAGLVGVPLIRLGQLAYLWNELQDAEQHLTSGLAAPRDEFAFVTLEGYITLAQVQATKGAYHAAYMTLHTAERFVRHIGRHEACERLAAWEAHLRLLQGDTAAATRWAKQAGYWGTPVDPFRFLPKGSDQLLIFCRILITLADRASLQQAEAILEQVYQYAIENQYRLLRIEAGNLLACCYVGWNMMNRAVAILAEILALVEQNGAIQLVIGTNPQIIPPLTRLARSGPLQTIATRVLHEIQLSTAHQPHKQLAEPLNSRELAILHSLAAGHSNAEIANRLTLAISTVQWYLKQIYRKLSVHNRTQAAMRARDLNLLSSDIPPIRG